MRKSFRTCFTKHSLFLLYSGFSVCKPMSLVNIGLWSSRLRLGTQAVSKVIFPRRIKYHEKKKERVSRVVLTQCLVTKMQDKVTISSSSSSSSSSSLALQPGVGFSLLHNTPPFGGSSEGFVTIILFWCGGCQPHAQPPTWRTRSPYLYSLEAGWPSYNPGHHMRKSHNLLTANKSFENEPIFKVFGKDSNKSELYSWRS
jgi:hypothetical protein